MNKIGTRADYHRLLAGKSSIGRDGCPFCDLASQESMVLWRGTHWFIIQNKFPYTGTTDHIMAVPYKHLILGSELGKEIWSEMREVCTWMDNFYWTRWYFSCTRETLSDGDRDARSIEHYHMHFIPGRLQGKYLRKMLQNQGFPVEEDL